MKRMHAALFNFAVAALAIATDLSAHQHLSEPAHETVLQEPPDDRGVTFHPVLRPGMTYRTTHWEEHSVVIDVADESLRRKLAEQGKNLPRMMKRRQTRTTVQHLEAQTGDGGIPVVAELELLNLSETEDGEPVPGSTHPATVAIGVRFHGRYTPERGVELQRMGEEAIEASAQSFVKSIFPDLVSVVDFPKRPLRIGEQFTEDASGESFGYPGVVVKNTYTLDRIAGEKAFFGVTQVVSSPGPSGSPRLTGSGKGRMEYDTRRMLVVHLEMLLRAKMTMTQSGTEFVSDLTQKWGRDTEITGDETRWVRRLRVHDLPAGSSRAPAESVAVRVTNVDDEGVVALNGSTIALARCTDNTCTNDTGWIDVTSKMRPGSNTVSFRLSNGQYGGWRYNFQLKAGTHHYDSGTVGREECPCNAPVLQLQIVIEMGTAGTIQSVSEPVITYDPMS